MTVSTTTTSVSYTGNGSTTSFAVTFPFFGSGSTAELEVIERVIATGAETTKSYSTHYTVTGGDGSTGAVVAGSAPADTVQWHIRRKTTTTQTSNYVTNDPFPADTLEGDIDRLAMSGQERDGDIAQAFRYPDTYTGGASIRMPEPAASKLLSWNSDADALENTTGRVTSVSVSAVSAGGSPTVSYDDTTGALALGVVTGNTGATGATGAAGDLTDPMTTRGDMIVRNSSNAVARLALGSANTVLRSDGSDLGYDTYANVVGSVGIVQGTHTIWVPASSMTVGVNAPSAAVASLDSGDQNITVPVLDFDGGSSDEVATFNVAFPKSWNAGTITARFFWTNSNANAGNVVWGLQGLCVVDSGALNTAMSDAGEVIQDANITTAGDLMVTAATPAITINGAADDGVTFFNVFRDASDTSNDTYASDARLVGVQIFYTVSAKDDS